MNGGARINSGRKALTGKTIVKRIPQQIWDEAVSFSAQNKIPPNLALLKLWESKAKNDSIGFTNFSKIEMSSIEAPSEKRFKPIEIVRLGKLIERLGNQVINPLIVLRLEPHEEAYRIIEGELQYWAYEALGVKRVKVFVVEPEGDLEGYQEQIQLLRNGHEAKELHKLREQKAELKSKLGTIQKEAQANIDKLTQKYNEARNEIERLAKEYSDMQAKLSRERKAESKSTSRKSMTIDA